MEQLSKQAIELREELQGLEDRMEGLATFVKRMILNEQMVS